MKSIIGNLIVSSIFASFIGGTLILLEMLIVLVIQGEGGLGMWIGGSFLVYLVTAIVASLLAVFIAGPVYLILGKFKLANYVSCILLGFFMVFLCIGLPTSLAKLYIGFTGGIIGVLFHYHYTHKPRWFSGAQEEPL